MGGHSPHLGAIASDLALPANALSSSSNGNSLLGSHLDSDTLGSRLASAGHQSGEHDGMEEVVGNSRSRCWWRPLLALGLPEVVWRQS